MAITGLGRQETCIIHHNRPAVARCGRCHKPICDECVVSTADGKFCSRECAAKTADFRASAGKFKKRRAGLGGLVKKLILIVIVVFALGAVNKYVYPVPFIGDLLDKLPIVGKSEKPAPPPPTPDAFEPSHLPAA